MRLNVEDKGNISRFVDMDWPTTYLSTVWHIWKVRNDVCFNNTHFSIMGVIHKSTLFALDIKLQISDVQGLHLDPINSRWFKHRRGFSSLM